MAGSKHDDAKTEVLSVEAGCRLCFGIEPRWTAVNAMAVAAKHSRLHGHPTWARQTIEVRYGGDVPAQKECLPGMESIPASGTASLGL